MVDKNDILKAHLVCKYKLYPNKQTTLSHNLITVQQ